MMKVKDFFYTQKKKMATAVCMAGMLIVLAGMTACSSKDSGEQITLEKAEEAAFADAGVTESEVTSIKTDQSQDNGVSVYDIEFYSGNIKYEYKVTADTGSIYSRSKEAVANQDNVTQETRQDNISSGTTGQDGNSFDTIEQDKGQISLDDAKAAALSDAGVSSSDAVFTKEELDDEDGIAVYDIEFYAENTEYEYEINVVTGEVYSRGSKTHNTGTNAGGNTAAMENYIGSERANSIALDHAGVSAADVTLLKSEFDVDDGQAVYEVEFYKDGKEYDYKINATDGSIIKYDMD